MEGIFMFAIKGPISFLTPVISCCHLLKVPFPHSLWSATLFMPNSKCKVIIGLHSVPEFVYPYTSTTGLPSWLNGNESTCSVEAAGGTGSIPRLGKSTRGGHGNPLQYSCLENPMDRGPGGLQSMGSQRVRHHWVT